MEITPFSVEQCALNTSNCRHAFEVLAAERYHYFYRAILKRVGNETDAADLVQETFSIAAASLEKYRGESMLSSWVFGIALNVIRDHRRKRYVRAFVDIGGEEEFGMNHIISGVQIFDMSAYSDPLDMVLTTEKLEQINKAFDTLRPQTKEALLKATFNNTNLDYDTLAAEMGVPVGTFKSRVSRARALIKANLTSAGLD